MENEAGFTLIEVLVGLVILGIFAGLVSVSLSGGLQAYNGMRITSSEVNQLQSLQRSLAFIGRQSFLSSENVQNGTSVLVFETDEKLSIQLEGDRYKLLWSGETGAETVFETKTEMRLRVGQLPELSKGERVGNGNSRQFIILEQRGEKQWGVLGSAPLVITAPSSCRYDIIGQRCR